MHPRIAFALLIVGVLVLSAQVAAQQGAHTGARNPCGDKANPCAPKASNPCNPCGKSTAQVAVNPCHAKHGKMFYVSDPMKRNVATFSSRAPLEDIIGTTNEIRGYFAFDPQAPNKGPRGSFSVPVASLNTGIPLRDEHLRGPEWLNASEHPEITFVIDQVAEVKQVKVSTDYQTYDLTLVGPLTVNGVTRQARIPARVAYLRESEQTKQKMPGNLLATRANFKVPLKDHQIRGFEGVVGSKVSDEIQVEVSIFASDAPAAANPCNPCNPCGKNKANPCAKEKS